MTKREEAEQAMRYGPIVAKESERVALLREAINEALEEAAALFDADLAKVEADYAWQKATPEGADSFDLWNWYCLAKSSAENNAKRIRALKKEGP